MTLLPVGMGELGDRETTAAGSVATAAVEAAFMRMGTRFVPSVPPTKATVGGTGLPDTPAKRTDGSCMSDARTVTFAVPDV